MGKEGHRPPASVAREAEKGLEYRGMPGGGGGTPVGVARARDLKNRESMSDETIMRMVNFFSRHRKNKSVAPEHRDEPWKDRGYVAWLLWGGDAGNAWANKVAKGIRASRTESTGSTMRELIESLESIIERSGSDVDMALAKEYTEKYRRGKSGYNLAPKGTQVSVHLNLNKPKFFSIKYPAAKAGGKTFGKYVVGSALSVVLENAFFFVSPTLAGKVAPKFKFVAKRDKGTGKMVATKSLNRTPYAGPTGSLAGVRLGNDVVIGEDFGPGGGGGVEIVFSPPKFPRIDGMLFCRVSGDDLIPVKSASSVTLKGWKVYASGVKDMTDAEIDRFLRQAKVPREALSFSASGKAAEPSQADLERLGISEWIDDARSCLF